MSQEELKILSIMQQQSFCSHSNLSLSPQSKLQTQLNICLKVHMPSKKQRKLKRVKRRYIPLRDVDLDTLGRKVFEEASLESMFVKP
jgi:hypothetical protein